MTRYEKIVNMSIEEMAENNIKEYFDYSTSDGKLFEKYNEAVEHEIEWLNEESEEL